jgi:uncharacterized Zn finger protein (UPF0148 family)
MRMLHDEIRNEPLCPVDPTEPNPCPECGAPLTEHFEGQSCLPTCTECAYSERREDVINMTNDLNQKIRNLKAAIEDVYKIRGVIAVGTDVDRKPYIQVYLVANLDKFDGTLDAKKLDDYYHLEKNIDGVEVFCLAKELPEGLAFKFKKEETIHEDIKAAD